MSYLLLVLSLGACGLAPPSVLSATELEITIGTAAAGLGDPGEMARQHCIQYGRETVLLKVQQLDIQTSRAVYYFGCIKKAPEKKGREI
jgi:hypothetical protein